MVKKVILVLVDGLNGDVARNRMGFLEALTDEGKGSFAKKVDLKSALPAMSRPLYETVMTGVKPVRSGIYNNSIVRLSKNKSIFSLAKENGLVTAASAYYWMSELYNHAPYDPIEDRIVNDKTLNIQHGIFYMWDEYPDEAVFGDGEYLRRNYNPDFLLIHSMNVDDIGHKFGLNSSEYRNSAVKVDVILSNFIEDWRVAGYHVIVTADHGMSDDKKHNGPTDEERNVPFYFFAAKDEKDGATLSAVTLPKKQTDICRFVCELLEV